MFDHSMHTMFYGNETALAPYFYRRHVDAAMYFIVIQVVLFLGGIGANLMNVYNCYAKARGMSVTRWWADLGATTAWAMNLALNVGKVVPAQMAIGFLYTNPGAMSKAELESLQDEVLVYSNVIIATFLVQLVLHFIIWSDGQREKMKAL